MITEFKTEFDNIATLLSSTFTTKKMSELEDHVQSYDFTQPLINWKPLANYDPTLTAANSILQNGRCVLQFITKAVTNDNYEDTKDTLVDQMITLSSNFLRKLNQNTNGIFIGQTFSGTSTINRNFTSNYCVMVELTITFTTAINYDWNKNCGTGTIPLTLLQYTNNFQEIDNAVVDGGLFFQNMLATLSPVGATADFAIVNGTGLSINTSTGEVSEGVWEDIPIGLTTATVTATGNGNYTGSVNFTVVFVKHRSQVLSQAAYDALTDRDDEMYYEIDDTL